MGKKRAKGQAGGPASISNRRARHDYDILETFEAGLVLAGSEVKSIFHGRASIREAFVRVIGGEAWLINMDIEPYEKAGSFIPDRRRDRKLLLHRHEIGQLKKHSESKGNSLIATKVYFKNRKAKIEIAAARGRKHHDKRDRLKEKAEQKAVRQGLE